MTVLLTGAGGFLGWHIRCRAAAEGITVVPAPKGWVDDPSILDKLLPGVTGVIHAAGVNRGSDDELIKGNETAAGSLARALRRVDRSVDVVYANSSQAGSTSVYGRAKARGAELLSAASSRFTLHDVRLANLFGEHGRPDYNSFIATFCHRLIADEPLEIVDDREVPLLHVQDAARYLLSLATQARPRLSAPTPEVKTVSEVRRFLTSCAVTYQTGEIPATDGRLERQLFSTFRSFCFPSWYPMAATPKSDSRGRLVECVRTRASEGQIFVSTTVPEAVRGEHYHLRKMERFMVIEGEATITLRRLFTNHKVRFRVNGAQPAIVDMPCMWTHNICNGSAEVVTTLFWTDELFDPASTDTYACPVDSTELAA
jgi:UDP-2-acetamido-2,6-beta-L-arabino-hexul-4-ose reductase